MRSVFREIVFTIFALLIFHHFWFLYVFMRLALYSFHLWLSVSLTTFTYDFDNNLLSWINEEWRMSSNAFNFWNQNNHESRSTSTIKCRALILSANSLLITARFCCFIRRISSMICINVLPGPQLSLQWNDEQHKQSLLVTFFSVCKLVCLLLKNSQYFRFW